MPFDKYSRWYDQRKVVIPLDSGTGEMEIDSGNHGSCRVSLYVDSCDNAALAAGFCTYEEGHEAPPFPWDLEFAGVTPDTPTPHYERLISPADEKVLVWWEVQNGEASSRIGELEDYSESQTKDFVIVDPQHYPDEGISLGEGIDTKAHTFAIRFNPGTSDFRRGGSELDVSPVSEGGTALPGLRADASFGDDDNAAVRAVVEVKKSGAVGMSERLGECEAGEGNIGSMTFEASVDSGFAFVDAVAHTYVLACTTAGDLSATPPTPVGVTIERDGIAGDEIVLTASTDTATIVTEGGKKLSFAVDNVGDLEAGDMFTLEVAPHPVVKVTFGQNVPVESLVPTDGRVTLGGGLTAVFDSGYTYEKGGSAVVTTPARGSFGKYVDGRLVGTQWLVGDSPNVEAVFGSDLATLAFHLSSWREYAPAAIEQYGCKFRVSAIGVIGRIEVELV